MGNLIPFWFIVIAVLWTGFFALKGFDFGVGMLHSLVGKDDIGRRAAINTIGPLWDGNEVWLIVAVAAMFAAFPGWYAAVFSTLYLPMLAILFGMIVRSVSIEWRGKVDDTKWRAWADFGIAAGSWLPAVLWGVAFAILVRGLPVDAFAGRLSFFFGIGCGPQRSWPIGMSCSWQGAVRQNPASTFLKRPECLTLGLMR